MSLPHTSGISSPGVSVNVIDSLLQQSILRNTLCWPGVREKRTRSPSSMVPTRLLSTQTENLRSLFAYWLVRRILTAADCNSLLICQRKIGSANGCDSGRRSIQSSQLYSASYCNRLFKWLFARAAMAVGHLATRLCCAALQRRHETH